jgi:hypothetical protein
MPKYLFAYRMPLAAYQAPLPVSRDEAMAPWVAFFATMGSAVVDPGQRVAERTELGEVGPATALGRYPLLMPRTSRRPRHSQPSPRRLTRAAGSRSACSSTRALDRSTGKAAHCASAL